MKSTNATTTIPPKESVSKKRWNWVLRIATFAAFFFLTTLVLVLQKLPSFGGLEFTVGEPAPRSLFAPFNLTYVNEEETESLRKAAEDKSLSILRMDPAAGEHIRIQADALFVWLHEVRGNRELREKKDYAWPSTVSEESKTFLKEEANLEEVRKYFEELSEQLYQRPVLGAEVKRGLQNLGIQKVLLLDALGENEVHLNEIPTIEDLEKEALGNLKNATGKMRREKSAAIELFNAWLQPNTGEDSAESKLRRQKARDSVAAVKESIKKNELIVQRGLLVTEDNQLRLARIQKVIKKQKVLQNFLAIGLLVLMIQLLGFLYMLFFESKSFLSFRITLLMHSIFFVTVLICKAISLWPEASPYLMPVGLAPLLIALLVNFRIGILSTAVMAVIVAPLSDFSAEILVATLISSATGVFTARKVRKRMQFLIVGLTMGVSYFLVIVSFQILQERTFQEAFFTGLQGLANGVLITTSFAFLLLPLFEYLFDLVTDITLLELSDLNHPLLKRMIVEAPGTYHHSLVVSTLAEAACENIGANALLARVGCYFHDIGKIARAEYFTENSHSQASVRHDKLTPTMSCLIIMNHVRDGIELGRRHKLRGPILRFIPEHQGTGIIYFFYKKALDQAKPGEKVTATDFRYPGPKPQSRETAVALLADSTEAASRSLKEPTPDSIRQLVRKIINDKFTDGQLDECNLTLRDLHRIQETFVRNLMAIFHTRVTYPDKPVDPDHVDLFQEDQFSKFRIKS